MTETNTSIGETCGDCVPAQDSFYALQRAAYHLGCLCKTNGFVHEEYEIYMLQSLVDTLVDSALEKINEAMETLSEPAGEKFRPIGRDADN